MKKLLLGLVFASVMLFSTNSNAQAMGADIDETFVEPAEQECYQEIQWTITWWLMIPIYEETMVTVCE
jgi:hypothetical protein